MDKIIYFNEPFFQDGIIAQAVDQVVAEDVAYFSSAGNNADQSYESVFVPGLILGNYTFHDFNPGAGVDIYQNIVLNNGEFSPVFQGDQPFASDAAAAETLAGQTANRGQFRFTRAGDTSSPLTVNFSIGGGATNGVDFNAGQSSRTLGVIIKDDALAEGTETVILSLESGAGYSAGAPSIASVEILDNETAALPSVNLTANLSGVSEDGGTSLIYAGLTPGETLAPEQFSLGALTPATRFIFNGATGQLGFDPDGSGAASLQSFAVLSPGLNLTEENILVV